MSRIDRETLRQLVVRWANGIVDAQEVHETAEQYYESVDCSELEDTHPDSIPNEVLSQLEILNVQWVTVDDVPAILAFLAAPAGTEEAAWDEWRAYWDGIDYEARREQIAGLGYYSIS